jgi:hypothetical protein
MILNSYHSNFHSPNAMGSIGMIGGGEGDSDGDENGKGCEGDENGGCC